MTDVAALPVRRDPLDALFRPTMVPREARSTGAGAAPAGPPAPAAPAPAPAPAVAPAPAGGDGSAAPRRAQGTRVRAGNAMGRTRLALLDGAARAVASSGTAITMAQVALTAGVAKATLYNHFRTREAVLSALALAEVEALAAEVRGLPVRQALVEAAAVVTTHPVLSTLREREPGVLATALAAPEPSAAVTAARVALVDLVAGAGLSAPERDVAADLLLRWLASLALAPGAPADVLAAVDLLLAGLLG